jgi:hypothetical protein
MTTITLGQLEHALASASRDIDKFVAPVVQRTAGKVAGTQRANVRKRSGKTARSIRATGPDGAAFGPLTVEAEIGPTWFVGRLIETGTVNQAPHVYVASSFEPHRAQHQAEVLDAAAAALSALTA